MFNGFGNINKNQFRMLAFSEQAPEKFYEKYKREICIPKIYYGKSGEALNEEAAAYIDVLDDLFTKSFAEKYHNRCRRYNMTFTGHILHEDDLGAQTAMSGSMMRFYEYMDYPGIDNLSAHNHCYWAAIQCASVARQLGKPFVLSELYGCTAGICPLENISVSAIGRLYSESICDARISPGIPWKEKPNAIILQVCCIRMPGIGIGRFWRTISAVSA